ncbi:MAG: flagellar hook-basal body complex protein FliE [Gammaproteobacteria bacterium]
MNVQQLLAQMRVLEAQAGTAPSAASEMQNPSVDFSHLLKNSVDAVNEASMESKKLSDAFEKGDPNISLAQVMISMEKASVSFQAMTQVRNRLLSAYQDIMNMPV